MNFGNKLMMKFEEDADKRLSRICRASMVLIAVVMLLNYLHIFKISNVLYPTLLASIVILFVPTIIYNFLHLQSKLYRYFVMTLVVVMSGMLYSILSYHVIIMLVFPVVVSCLYCDRNSVIFTVVLNIPVMVAAHLVAFYLKIVPDEPLVTLKGVVFYGILPRVIELFAVSFICLSVTSKLQRLIKELIDKNNELYADQLTLIESISELVEAQSRETGQHIKRVAAYTELLCRAMGLSEEEVWKVSVASMMHDVGKIGISQDILHKPARLTDEEFEAVKKHVDHGYEILHNSPGEIMQIAAVIAQQHHERYDGTGYQLKLKGDQIDLFARCVAIADVFDALVSKRCYKESWSPEAARAEILEQSGHQFDPELTKLFDTHFDEFVSVMKRLPD